MGFVSFIWAWNSWFWAVQNQLGISNQNLLLLLPLLPLLLVALSQLWRLTGTSRGTPWQWRAGGISW